jgi:hypothetical protein
MDSDFKFIAPWSKENLEDYITLICRLVLLVNEVVSIAETINVEIISGQTHFTHLAAGRVDKSLFSLKFRNKNKFKICLIKNGRFCLDWMDFMNEDKTLKTKDQEVQDYYTELKEYYRSPSKGGNTKAQHLHTIIIDNERYTFYALGSKKFVYKGETVSFEYILKDGKYRNVNKQTIKSKDKNGNEHIRGNRGYKSVLRSESQRMPGSRREQR